MEEITGAEATSNNQIGEEPIIQTTSLGDSSASPDLPPLPSTIVPESHVPLPGEDSSEWQIAISEPQKAGEGMMGTYTTYTITIRTTNPNFKAGDWTVIRRYSDFEWLRSKLCSAFRGTIVPPMPEKAPLNRFDPDLLTYRRKELERFLKRVLLQPLFLQNEDLRCFLEASEAALEQAKLAKTSAAQPPKSFFSGLMDKVVSAQAAIGTPDEVDDWFDQQRSYWQTIENNIGLLLARTSSVSKRHKELGQTWIEFSQISDTVAGNEAPCDAVMSTYHRKMSEVTAQLGNLEKEMADNQTNFYEDNLKDWIRVINAAHEIMNNRQTDLYLYQNATKTRESKQEKLNKNPSSAPAQADLNDAEARENSCRNQFEIITKSVRDELEALNKTKSAEISVAMRRLVQNSINYHLNAVSLWKEVLQTIEDQEHPEQ